MNTNDTKIEGMEQQSAPAKGEGGGGASGLDEVQQSAPKGEIIPLRYTYPSRTLRLQQPSEDR